MELPVNKEELTYIFKEIGLELDAKPGEYIFEIADFYLPGVNAKRLFKETENIDELNYLAGILSNLDDNEYQGCGRGTGAYKERCRPYKHCLEYGVLLLYSRYIRL